jgi:two-component system response regulator HydG
VVLAYTDLPRPLLPWLHLQLPPLRERQEDVPLLTRSLLQRAADRAGLTVAPAVPPAVDAQLLSYEWPGNVRELELTMEVALSRALARGGGTALQLQDLSGFAGRLEGNRAAPAAGAHGWDVDGASIPPLAAMERLQIIRALEASGWHQGRAAVQLGISAKTLYRKIREFQLTRPNARGAIPVRSRAE